MPDQQPRGDDRDDANRTRELPIAGGTSAERPTEDHRPRTSGAETPLSPPELRRPGPPRGRIVAIAAAGLALLVLGVVAGALLGGGGERSASTTNGPAAATGAAPTTSGTAGSTGGSAQPTGPGTQVPGIASVQVVGSGLTQLPPEPDGDVKATWAVVLRNPSRDQVATNILVRVSLRNGAGRVRATDDTELDVLLPGQTGAVGKDTSAANASRMDVTALVGSWQPVGQLQGQVRASNVRTFRAPDGDTESSVTLRSTFAQPVDVDAVAVWRDRAGRIIGGTSDGVDHVPAGVSVARIDTSSAPRNIPRTEVYVTLKSFPPGG